MNRRADSPVGRATKLRAGTAKAVTPTVLLLLFATAALACQIPVFRYALDRWEASPYLLKTSADLKMGQANLKVQSADGGKHELFAPFDKQVPIWTGDKLDEKGFAALVDSPKRKEIVKRILAGESAVWVVVGSGDKKADKEIYDRLVDRLTFFQSVAELPEIDPDDPANQLGPGPELKIKFSVMKLERDDPDEQLLVRMLAGPKLDKLPKKEPFVAPVFGQGRVLGAWPAKTMDVEGIEEACFFLTGACSCIVKADNPGWDMLLSTDWKKGLREAADKETEEVEEK